MDTGKNIRNIQVKDLKNKSFILSMKFDNSRTM